MDIPAVIPAIPAYTANAAKGVYPEGFADGVSITVIKRNDKIRLLRGAGKPLEMGTWVEIISDQSRRRLGEFKVVGWAIPDTGEQDGEVPDRKLPMLHMK